MECAWSKIGCLWIEGKTEVGVRNLDFFAGAVNEWLLTKLLFAIKYDFFFFCPFTLCSFIVFLLFCMLSERDNHNFEKERGRTTNLKINLKTHYTQVSFIWTKKGRNKNKSCRSCWIRLIQICHILQKTQCFS